MSAPSVAEIKDSMRATPKFFYLKTWSGTSMPRLWRRTARGSYAPVTPAWLRSYLQPVAGEMSHTLAVKVLDSDLSGFPPVPDAGVST